MAMNPSRGMIQEMSGEERGGGGQKEDEKVFLDPFYWPWVIGFGSLILDPVY